MAKPAELALSEMRKLGYTHRLVVQAVYRRVLRQHGDWDMDRRVWNDSCARVRDEFEAARKESDRKKTEAFLQKQMEWLTKFRHPDPYRFPWQEGGATYERNLPPPEIICRDEAQVYFPSETKSFSGRTSLFGRD